MNSDAVVREALKTLADADATRKAPAHLEGALLAAVDRERSRDASRRSTRRLVFAAFVVIVVAIPVYRILVVPEVAVAPVRSTDWQMVSTTDDSDVSGHIVRVRLPRSALPLFGIPIVDPEIEETVNVELWLGEDGQTRSLRIVQ